MTFRFKWRKNRHRHLRSLTSEITLVRKCSSRIRASDNVHVAKNSPISAVSPPCSYNINSWLPRNQRGKYHARFSWALTAHLLFDVTVHTRIMTVLTHARQLMVLSRLEVLNLFCYVSLLLSNKFAIRLQIVPTATKRVVVVEIRSFFKLTGGSSGDVNGGGWLWIVTSSGQPKNIYIHVIFGPLDQSSPSLFADMEVFKNS